MPSWFLPPLVALCLLAVILAGLAVVRFVLGRASIGSPRWPAQARHCWRSIRTFDVLPAFLWSDGLRIVIVMGNLEYKTRLIYEGLVDRSALRVVYAVIVISSLLL
jgi:hypothetical protein